MKSSNSGPAPSAGEAAAEVVVATGLRLRGAGGHLTARLVPGGIDQLGERTWVLIGRLGGPTTRYELEEHRSYADKVVVKLRGIDGAGGAAGLVGQDILLPCNGLVDLPEGAYYIFELVGLRVCTRDGRELGTVREVVRTGGTPLLAVEPVDRGRTSSQREEILLPAARAICTRIDTRGGTITVDPPDGLLELYGL